MTERRAGPVAAVVALTALLLAAGVLHARGRAAGSGADAEEPLYLPSGAIASRVFLSFDAIAADLYWIRAIRHDGQERHGAGRFRLLEPLVDLAVTLDPTFNIAYRVGATLLALEPPNGPGRPDRAIALLEKGLRSTPDRWQYAHDIGFVHYWYTGRFDEAARWFRRAADMPGAPPWLEPLAAHTLMKGGDRQGARQLLVALAAGSNGYIKQSAERGLAQLQALDDLDLLQGLVNDRFSQTGAYPPTRSSLETLGVSRGVRQLADPAGRPYFYDPSRGLVGLAPDSPLSPLPGPFVRQ